MAQRRRRDDTRQSSEMRTLLLRFALLGVPVLALAGCSFAAFTYTNDRYGLIMETNITLRCRDTYQVYDRPDLSTLLVMSNPLNEALNCLEGGQPPLAARQREVAQIFLQERTNRPQCRVAAEVELSVYHREFSYSCAPVRSQRQT